jgi:hypothetical protein
MCYNLAMKKYSSLLLEVLYVIGGVVSVVVLTQFLLRLLVG